MWALYNCICNVIKHGRVLGFQISFSNHFRTIAGAPKKPTWTFDAGGQDHDWTSRSMGKGHVGKTAEQCWECRGRWGTVWLCALDDRYNCALCLVVAWVTSIHPSIPKFQPIARRKRCSWCSWPLVYWRRRKCWSSPLVRWRVHRRKSCSWCSWRFVNWRVRRRKSCSCCSWRLVCCLKLI